MLVRILGDPFGGAPMRLPFKSSKRKILGIYEHETKPWWSSHMKSAEAFIDAGAADGYFTYGGARALSKGNRDTKVLAFEPELASKSLKRASLWPAYRNVQFEFVDQYVGGLSLIHI